MDDFENKNYVWLRQGRIIKFKYYENFQQNLYVLRKYSCISDKSTKNALFFVF